jgi:ComEC/Rec2-related protein
MRETVEGRPLVLVALAVTLGLFGRQVPLSAILILIPVLLLSSFKLRGTVLLAWLVGLVFAPARAEPLPRIGPYEGGIHVRSVPMPSRAGGDQAVAQTARGVLLVQFPKTVRPSVGDRFAVTGRTELLSGRQAELWLRRGVQGRLVVNSARPLEEGPIWFRWGRLWRESFRDFTERTLPPNQAQLLDALCFNVDAALNPELAAELRRAGVIHIVSASGLHVTIFALALQVLLGRLPCSRVWQLVILLLILLIYAGAAGFRPPVFRAVVMAAVGLFAFAFRREGDTLSSLSLAALLQIAFDPRAVFDLGFQLSYLIVGALALFMGFGDGELRSPISRSINDTIRASWVATLAASPLLAYAFGSVSLVAVFANLAIAPLVLPVMAGSLGAWLMGLLLPALGAAILTVCGALTVGIEVVANAFGGLPFAAVSVAPFSAWWLVPIYGGMLLLHRQKLRPPVQR